MNYSGIACAIMAGGQNSRMGCPKAFLKYGGKAFIELVKEYMAVWFDDIFIVTDDRSRFSDAYGSVYEDIIPDSGPMGALYTALSIAKTKYVFCVACDIPYPNHPLISRIIMESQQMDYDCIVPQGVKGLEPLFALYKTALSDLIGKQIASRQLKISDIYENCWTKYVDIRHDRLGVLNINTPEEYLRYADFEVNLIEKPMCLVNE